MIVQGMKAGQLNTPASHCLPERLGPGNAAEAKTLFPRKRIALHRFNRAGRYEFNQACNLVSGMRDRDVWEFCLQERTKLQRSFMIGVIDTRHNEAGGAMQGSNRLPQVAPGKDP
jgi:hypothetical protein